MNEIEGKGMLKIPLYINNYTDPIILNIPYQPERLNEKAPQGDAKV